MTWQEMFQAIKALDDDACLRMRKPGDWYVDCRVEIGGDGMLTGTTGNGDSPEEAVRDQWNQYATLPPGRYLVTHALNPPRRRQYRWAGFMWREVEAAP